MDLQNTEKRVYKLTKSYLFPFVGGSQFSMIATNNRVLNAFVHFISKANGFTKVVNYNNAFNSFLGMPIHEKVAYGTYGLEVKAVQKANKYLSKQYSRMAKALEEGNMERYTSLWRLLRDRSDCYLLVMIVRKLPFYSSNYSPLKVRSLMGEVRRMLSKESTNLKVKRVFLPELNPDGSIRKHRPLGVPSVQWRVISAMYEMYLVNILKPHWNENQFACMPNKGVADAWIKILTHVDKARHVTGIDLAKFFDVVFINGVRNALMKYKVDPNVISFLTSISYKKAIVGPKDRKLEDTRIANLNKEVPLDTLAIDVWKWLHEDKPYVNTPRMFNPREVGLPQGLATSPLLACLVLGETKAMNSPEIPGVNDRIIHYMDDAVLMSDLINPLEYYIDEIQTSSTGIMVSEKKTEIIKRGAKWIKALKFLGCEYDGQTFKANTRKGGVFIVKEAHLKIAYIIKWLELNKGDLKGYARTNLNKLISQGWNHIGEFMISESDKKDWTLWDSHKLILTHLNKNSVEAQAVNKYLGMGNPIIGSTNTLSMLNSGYMLNFINQGKAQTPKSTRGNHDRNGATIGDLAFYFSWLLICVSIIWLGFKSLIS